MDREPEIMPVIDETIPNDSLNIVRGAAGMAVGAVVGYFICYWIVRQGFYAIAMPGIVMGMCARYALQKPSYLVQWLCAIFALLVGLYTEWSFFPFVKDQGLLYYIAHLHQLRPLTWIMILAGAALAFHFSKKDIEPSTNYEG